MGTAAGGTRGPVLIPRPPGRGDALTAELEQRGILTDRRPFIDLELEDGEELRRDVEQLVAGAFSHLVLTSRTAVEALLAAGLAARSPHDPPPGPAAPAGSGPSAATGADGPLAVTARPLPRTIRVIAVGAGTAAALERAGIAVDVVAGGSGTAVVEALPATAREETVLFPASSAAAPTVREGLEAKGYRVRQIVAYRPRPLHQPAEVTRALRHGEYAAVVLTSPMIARLAADIGVHEETAVVTIGRPTSDAARTAGLSVAVQAEQPESAAIAAAVDQVLHPRSTPSSPSGARGLPGPSRTPTVPLPSASEEAP